MEGRKNGEQLLAARINVNNKFIALSVPSIKFRNCRNQKYFKRVLVVPDSLKIIFSICYIFMKLCTLYVVHELLSLGTWTKLWQATIEKEKLAFENAIVFLAQSDFWERQAYNATVRILPSCIDAWNIHIKNSIFMMKRYMIRRFEYIM